MNYRVYDTRQEAETAQRQKHYMAMVAQYNAYIGVWSEAYQVTISAEFIQQLYQAPKLFLDCSIEECWEFGYNRVLGFNNGEIKTDFVGSTTDYAIPLQTITGKWALPENAELSGGEFMENVEFELEN